MTGTMRGICKTRPAAGAEYRTDIPIPQITEDQVLMKIHATAICGTQLLHRSGLECLGCLKAANNADLRDSEIVQSLLLWNAPAECRTK